MVSTLKKGLLAGMAILCGLSIFAQSSKPKYKGLLWEISGNGLNKPSYLYGTMHVSNKLAFNFGDSFYVAIKSADMVGLETDPSQWFSNMLNSKYYTPSDLFGSRGFGKDEFDEDAFEFGLSTKLLSRGLSYTPEIVNGFLYRYENRKGDFQEDTYLDLYIYQTARKLKKQVLGVEDFEESERLVGEARESMRNGKRKVMRNSSYLQGDITFESAYRSGDLDLIDTLQKLEGYPEEYYENMLYQRNRNMVRSMDSLMKTKVLFVGVGCAHLPGEKGVINLLREKGYQLRPVFLGIKTSREKERLDKVISDVNYIPQQSGDNLFEVSVPQKLYAFPKEENEQQYLCQDMANGAYYHITRIRSYASFFNQDISYSMKRLDSILYENIAGQIISRKTVKTGEYPGYDILNRTRKGNLQRSRIVVMPNEIIVFRMNGQGDYVGRNSDAFFNSIKLKPQTPSGSYRFRSTALGIEAWFPHEPLNISEHSGLELAGVSRNEFVANTAKTSYLLMHKVANNYEYIEEDSFELELMADGVVKALNVAEHKRSIGRHKGLPCITLLAKNADSQQVHFMILIKGISAYMLGVNNGSDNEASHFFNSFGFLEREKPQFREHTDTASYFSVKTAVKPVRTGNRSYYGYGMRDEKKFPHLSQSKNIYFIDPQTGQEIRVNVYRYHRFYSARDSASYWKYRFENLKTYIPHNKSYQKQADHVEWNLVLGDTGSQRALKMRVILKGGVTYTLTATMDTNALENEFVNTFFSTFRPADTTIGRSPFTDITPYFLADLYSKDSATKAQAVQSINEIVFRAKDAGSIMKAIDSLPYSKDYIDLKSKLISEIGYTKDPKVIPYLVNLYGKVTDTISFQIAVLYALSDFTAEKPYRTWKDLLLADAPIVSESNEVDRIFHNINYWDSLQFTKSFFPDMCRLLSNEDYREHVYRLMATLLDSNIINAVVFKNDIGTIVNDARKTLKKHFANNDGDYNPDFDSRLECFNKILVSYYALPNVQAYFNKLLLTPNISLKLETARILLKNKLPVPDSIWQNWAAKDEYRIEVYTLLKELNRLDKFPKEQSRQDLLAQSVAWQRIRREFSKPDTVALLSSAIAGYKGKSGRVYFFKFKKSSEDDYWKLALVGLQPHDTSKFESYNALAGVCKNYFDENRDITSQFRDELKTMRIRKRKMRNEYGYYERNYYNNEYYDGDED